MRPPVRSGSQPPADRLSPDDGPGRPCVLSRRSESRAASATQRVANLPGPRRRLPRGAGGQPTSGDPVEPELRSVPGNRNCEPASSRRMKCGRRVERQPRRDRRYTTPRPRSGIPARPSSAPPPLCSLASLPIPRQRKISSPPDGAADPWQHAIALDGSSPLPQGSWYARPYPRSTEICASGRPRKVARTRSNVAPHGHAA